MKRDQFFAQLDQLSPAEIEAQLPAWDIEQLILAQEYINQKAAASEDVPPTKVPPKSIPPRDNEAQSSLEVARRAHTAAMMAIIISIGAMLAALAAALLAFLALRGATLAGG
jgi:hypothetical protein